jgi:diguanylate cyclase (GGDEF)-like protein
MPVNAPNFASALATPLLHGPHLAAAALLALFFGLAMRCARRASTTHRHRLVGGCAVAAGAGLWALQFFPLTGLGLPWSVSFRGWVVAGAGLVALTGMLLVMASARLSWADTTRQTVQGLGVGALWAVLQAMALASLGDQPGVRGATAVLAWAGLPVALVAAAALAGLWVAFNARWAAMGPFPLRLWVGAVGFGLVSGLAQALALGGLGFEESARPVGVLLIGESALELACGAGAVALLLGLFGALIDTRASSRNRELASSLSEANRRLREQALSDPLTRLPNRLLFEERLEAALERVDAPNAGDAALAVMFIDLDGFKPVNDSFGHTAGDAVLREVGQRLHNLARQSDVVARVGGDEFLLLAERPGGEAGASQVAQRVLQAVAKPYRLPNGAEVHLSCSIGIVMYPENGPSPKLLANADAASTQPSAPAAPASPSSTPAGSTTRERSWNCSTTCAVPSTATSWCCTTSPRWMAAQARSLVWRPWCAGSIRCAAWLHRASSSQWLNASV